MITTMQEPYSSLSDYQIGQLYLTLLSIPAVTSITHLNPPGSETSATITRVVMP